MRSKPQIKDLRIVILTSLLASLGVVFLEMYMALDSSNYMHELNLLTRRTLIMVTIYIGMTGVYYMLKPRHISFLYALLFSTFSFVTTLIVYRYMPLMILPVIMTISYSLFYFLLSSVIKPK